MVKHTQIICPQFADKLFERIWPFYGIGAERVKIQLDFHAVLTRRDAFLKYHDTLNLTLCMTLKKPT